SDEHAPAVLAWLVDGCLAWQREGLRSCGAVDAASQRYRADMNRLAGFAEERLEITKLATDEVPCKAMREVYDAWCRASGVRAPLNAKQFAARLRDLGGITGGDDASKKIVRTGVAGFQAKDRHWRGVRLRE